MSATLVCDALSMAIQQRQPVSGLIVHSDQDSQYASELYQNLLNKHGFICSMSRKGNCWDNAVAERLLWSNLSGHLDGRKIHQLRSIT
ncbi:MAG: DDE-type integrase/transposase/recombinase [Burkholderiales bacterium]|nr:DDE-type integrase/transposase/recombinase [Burkholderiales bacterium]